MEERVVEWKWEGKTFEVPCDVRGDGKRALLMVPSINMASCRKELRPVTALLAPTFKSYALDWPGFGESSRLNVTYSPEMFAAFLLHAVQSVIEKETVDVVACGHASGYVLQAAKANPKLWSRIALVAPTYRAPVKAMGMNPWMAMAVRGAFKAPLLGDVLYSRVTQPSFLAKQYKSHVFADEGRVTEEFVQEKAAIVDREGGRFGPSSFFTGQLDVVDSRESFLQLAHDVTCPLRIFYGEQSPERSLAEMKAMAEDSNLDVAALPGSLGIAEEFPSDVAQALNAFLK